MLPDRYKPKDGAEETTAAVELKDRVITDSESAEALMALGFTQTDVSTLKALDVAGRFVDQIGLIRIQKGKCLVLQNDLQSAVTIAKDLLAKEALKPKPSIGAAIELMRGISTVAKPLISASKMMLEFEQHNSALKQAEKGPPRRTFAPGEKVRPINNVTNIVTSKVEISNAVDTKTPVAG